MFGWNCNSLKENLGQGTSEEEVFHRYITSGLVEVPRRNFVNDFSTIIVFWASVCMHTGCY